MVPSQQHPSLVLPKHYFRYDRQQSQFESACLPALRNFADRHLNLPVERKQCEVLLRPSKPHLRPVNDLSERRSLAKTCPENLWFAGEECHSQRNAV